MRKNPGFRLFFASLFLFAAGIALPLGKDIPFTLKEQFFCSPKNCLNPIVPSLPEGRAYLLIVDSLTIEDICRFHLSSFRLLLEKGAVGLMNCNTGGNDSKPENAYAAIGAGSGSRSAGLPNSIGALGTALHEAGLKTAVVGNADTLTAPGRQAVTVAVDENGLVDFGEVGAGMLVNDSSFPGSFRTSFEKLFRTVEDLSAKASFLVIETGDLSRLKEYGINITGEAFTRTRREALLRIDSFLGELLRHIKPEKDLLLVVSPAPGTTSSGRASLLSPVMAVGAGVQQGFLFSPSTKRAGIVLNTDLAPTVLNFFSLHVPPGHFFGQPLQVTPGENRLSVLMFMQEKMALTYRLRPLLQKGYIIYQLGVIAAGLCAVFWCRKAKDILHPFLLSVAAVPLSYLLLSLTPELSVAGLLFKFFTFTAGITLFAMTAEKFVNWGSFLFLGLFTAAAIIGDTLAGSPLQKNSIMGYDPVVGARFYGIGNEYMGVLIGSLIAGCTALGSAFPRRRKFSFVFSLGAFFLALLVLGSSRWGTNLGGTIAAFVAFGTTTLLLRGVRYKLSTFCLLTIIAVLLAGIAFFSDLRFPPADQSHFGRNAAVILGGGWQEVFGIIERKAQMNIKLFKYTIWSRVFAASLGSLALLFCFPVGIMAKVKDSFPDFFAGFLGTVAGSIAALFFNDSGVVAAATTMIYTLPLLIMIVLKNTKNFI